MEIHHRIIAAGQEKARILAAELEKAGLAYRSRSNPTNSIETSVAESHPCFPSLAQLVADYELNDQPRPVFSDADRAAAEWFTIRAGEFQYPQPEDAYHEATFDLSAYCWRCDIGAVQNRPFRLVGDFRQKLDFFGLHWVTDEIFLRQETRQLFEQEKLSGAGYLQPTLFMKGKPIDGLYQLKLEAAAEPGFATADLFRVTCKPGNEEGPAIPGGKPYRFPVGYPYCGRVKYHLPERGWLCYARTSLAGKPDLFKSWEYFGAGDRAERLILASRKVYDLARQKGFRGLVFTPIQLV